MLLIVIVAVVVMMSFHLRQTIAQRRGADILQISMESRGYVYDRLIHALLAQIVTVNPARYREIKKARPLIEILPTVSIMGMGMLALLLCT